MIDRKILFEKMSQFGIDWIGSSGFLDEGQVNHVLDIVEKESGLMPETLVPDACPYCLGSGKGKMSGVEVGCMFCSGTGKIK